MTTIKRELKPLHCGQKSFYHKAIVIETWNGENVVKMQLQSYETIVCIITLHGTGKVTVNIENMYSKTTKRHIKDFILQMFRLTAWARIEKEYSEGVTIWEF